MRLAGQITPPARIFMRSNHPFACLRLPFFLPPRADLGCSFSLFSVVLIHPFFSQNGRSESGWKLKVRLSPSRSVFSPLGPAVDPANSPPCRINLGRPHHILHPLPTLFPENPNYLSEPPPVTFFMFSPHGSPSV